MADYEAPQIAREFRIPPWAFAGALAAIIVLLLWWKPSLLTDSIIRPPFLISEIQAENWTTLADSDGDYSDWIELHNPGKTPQALTGYHLTDDFKDLKKWRFPEIELEPGGFLVVFASGKNRTQFLDDLHTNFSLDGQGEYLALVDPTGTQVVQEYLPKFPKQAGDDSYGIRESFFKRASARFPGSYAKTAYYDLPSPGAPNQGEYWGQVSDTHFSRDGGFVDEPFRLELSTDTPQTRIRYTTDGSWPTEENGREYTGPLLIERSGVIRVAAFRTNYKPSNIDTQTYLFPDDLLKQNGRQLPPHWGMKGDWEVPADYEMDPEVWQGASDEAQLLSAWKSLPSVSMVVDTAALFDREQGIYANPESRGNLWERSASIEWFPAEGKGSFRANCGVSIHGGLSRLPEESPKHSFRLLFRDRFGVPELREPLFGKEAPKRFRNLVLRAGSNNSWLHWDPAQRVRGDLLRDEWVRRTSLALGQTSARGRLVHLFLNGAYWGVYDMCERPDVDFLAARWDGDVTTMESRDASGALAGDETAWRELFALANQGLGDDERYAVVGQLLDLDAFIDYMLLQIYGGSPEWGMGANWYAGRSTQADGQFRFLAWDSERVLENVDDDIMTVDADSTPSRLFQRLLDHADFRDRFASRARVVLGERGALSRDVATARYRALADEARSAMVLESARWGDYRRDTHPYRSGPYQLYGVASHWEPEVRRLLDSYFPLRTERVIDQLRQRGLWPEG